MSWKVLFQVFEIDVINAWTVVWHVVSIQTFVDSVDRSVVLYSMGKTNFPTFTFPSTIWGTMQNKKKLQNYHKPKKLWRLDSFASAMSQMCSVHSFELINILYNQKNH